MGMDHKKWREAVLSLKDGEVSLEERRAAQAHLASCAECREEQEGWKRISGALFSPEPVLRTDIFVQKVMARIEESEPRPAVWRWAFLLPTLAMAASLLLFIPGREQTAEVSTDALLTADAGTSPAWLLSKEAPGENEAVGMVWEDDL